MSEEFKPEVIKFLSYVEDYSDVNACWIWRGTKSNGYGQFAFENKQYRAHRWLYEECFGKIPEALVLDHLCYNRACVNPQHMEPVTLIENSRRANALRANKEYCSNGHARTPESTYITRFGQSLCRICRHIAKQRHYYKGKV